MFFCIRSQTFIEHPSAKTQEAQKSIVNFVALYNEATLEFRNLTDAEQDGPLRGDTIFQGILRNMRSIGLGQSSSPGEELNSLSNIGISVDKTGQLLFDEAKLSEPPASATIRRALYNERDP